MSPGKVALYIILGLVALVVVSAVVSVVFAALAIAWFTLRLLIVLAVLGGAAYVGYRIYQFLTGSVPSVGRSKSTNTATSEVSRNTTTSGVSTSGAGGVEGLKQQYANGELTEREFERRLERELDDRSYDSIDRELQRDQI